MRKKEETYEEIADITDLIKHDFLMYALSNSKRSLPNIVDGLKPSQRRLIYAMRNEKGLTKSARVVGETLGKYHTHGDCLQGDTKFYLRNGDIKTIKELYLMGETIETLSVDEDGEIVPSKAHSFRIGQWVDKKYHIHLSNGGIITATGNHPFMDINKDWVRTEHLEVGQYLYSGKILYRNLKKKYVNEFNDEFVKITKIEIENVEKEPMFDFTVDKFHNAIIITHEASDSSSFGYIVAHNSSVYDALVRLSQPWKLNLPLIDGQGNFGSIEGDGAAAMRYTECKLSDFARDVYLSNLEDIEYIDNYDGREKEPVTFIPTIPVLLINGSKGIGTAIDTSIPPHNINEVIDATIAFIMQKKEGDIVSCIKGPDFPTGGLIDSRALMKGLVTGSGSVYSICKTHIESSDYGRFCLVIDSIPYQTETTYITDALIKGFKTAGEDSYFKLIADLSNETSSEGIRIVIKFKKGVDENKIYKIEEFLRSQEILMKKINYSMNALNTEESFTYKKSIHGFLMEWYKERVKVKERYYERRLNEEKRKLRELEIIEIVIKNHKKIFDIIYNNTDDRVIHKELLKYISDLSVDEMDIIYKINVKKLKKKGEDIIKEVDMIKSIIALLEEERNDINRVIIKELKEIKKKYSMNRRSEII